MEDFNKLPQNLQTQNNFDRLVELEQKKLEVEKLRLGQSSTGNGFVTRNVGDINCVHSVICFFVDGAFQFELSYSASS